METQIHVLMEVDGNAETRVVSSLFDAGAWAASFIRHLDLEAHVDSDIRIEVQIVKRKPEPGWPEF
jgi:hypothetical protein